MLTSINGYLGGGKTLLSTKFALLYAGNVPVYSNYEINHEGVQTIDIEDLEQINQGVLIIDEAYAWMESRRSGSDRNEYMSRVMFQSRKRGFDVYTTEQIHSSIDLRYRELEDLTIHALGLNARGTSFEYIFEGFGCFKRAKLSMFEAEKIFKMYDTNEYPDVAPSVYEPIKYNAVVNAVITKFRRKFGKEKLRKLKLTRHVIKDYMLEKDIYDKAICEGVYARLQRQKFM